MINLAAIAGLRAQIPDFDIMLIESGGDNLAATFSPELAGLTIDVIDVCMGADIPRNRGPAILKSDLLLLNKIELADHVGANSETIRRDAKFASRKIGIKAVTRVGQFLKAAMNPIAISESWLSIVSSCSSGR